MPLVHPPIHLVHQLLLVPLQFLLPLKAIQLRLLLYPIEKFDQLQVHVAERHNLNFSKFMIFTGGRSNNHTNHDDRAIRPGTAASSYNPRRQVGGQSSIIFG